MPTSVNQSKFNMLRAMIAMAHADGHMDESEIAYIEVFMNRLELSEEQQAILEVDIEKAQDPIPFIEQIEDPAYKSQVIHFANILAHKDGHKHPSEEQLLEKIIAAATPEDNIVAIKADVHEYVLDSIEEHDENIENAREKGNSSISIFGTLDRLLLKLGIDILS